MGQGEGRGSGDNDHDCGRRGLVVAVVEGRGKRLGGKGGMGATDFDERGGHTVVIFFG